MKICINELDHMTNMAAMPIYGKKPLKIFSRTNWGWSGGVMVLGNLPVMGRPTNLN